MIVLTDGQSDTGERLEAALQAAGLNPEAPPLHVNWTGARVRGLAVPVLNSESRTDKLAQLVRLHHQRVSVPEFVINLSQGENPFKGWVPRRRFHQQGRDFRFPPKNPDFWTKYISTDEEWRVHFFRTAKGNLRLLRSALKVPKEGADPLIRSHRSGWKLSYCGGAPEVVVEEGRKAVNALALDFGAVDVLYAFREEGKAYVLEVNTCPGLEGGTLQRYVDQILERSKASCR